MESELSKLDAVLDKLEKVKRNSHEFIACCPAHEDKNPSLTINTGSKWIVFHCHAGCNNDAIRRALGLEWKDLILDENSTYRKRPVRQRELELTTEACCLRLQNEPEVLTKMRYGRGWAARAFLLLGVGWDGSRLTLPVRDKEGKLHDVLRYDPFTKQGRKIYAGKGKSRMPFPAPETVNTRILFLVEGEGTAISLLSIGLHAVALPGSIAPSHNVARPGNWRGTGWHKTWALRFLKFQHLILLPDCDGPGRALMGAARYDLEKAGVPVSIVDLGPKSNDGRDVADVLLSQTYDGDSRLVAKTILREIVAEQAEVLVPA